MEKSIVRNNLTTVKGYTPYCGDEFCKPRESYPLRGERWPRLKFNGKQFICTKCGYTTNFAEKFIEEYIQFNDIKV